MGLVAVTEFPFSSALANVYNLLCYSFCQPSRFSSLGGETIGKKCSTVQRRGKPDCYKFYQTRDCLECVHQVM